MPAYVIVDIEVTDPARYEDYKKLAPGAVAAYGGQYLARGGQTEVLEGTWQPKRLVILEFASVAQAKAWVDSAEYRPARELRQQSARSNMVVVEGMAA
jgi:uncharacterized protein (DUF1330 family)